MSQEKITNNDIKRGFFWTAIESYSGQIIQFVIGVILARLLMPSAYGTIALTSIFLCISDALLTSGLPTALLREKECSEDDRATIFTFNITVAILMFGILWLCSPYIADFYNLADLKWVLRGMAGTFVIGSLSTVSTVLLKRDLKFKRIAIIRLTTSILTGIIAIYMAYRGAGVWALVSQALFSSLLSGVLIIQSARWLPRFGFSKVSFLNLFGFGSKILVGNLFTQVYQNMYGITIGKFFSAADVAYFTRGDGYSKLVPINVAGVIQRALLPMLAKIQDNIEALRSFNRKMTNASSFLIFPLSMILAGTAYPLISVMLTDKWIFTAPILQILCIGVLPDHLYCINNDFLLVKGRSDLMMKEKIYSQVIAIVLFAVSIPFGIMWIAVGKGVTSLIQWYYSAVYLKRTLGVSVYESVAGIIIPLIISVVIGLIDWIAFLYLPYKAIWLIVSYLFSGGAYLLAAKLLFPEYLHIIKQLR